MPYSICSYFAQTSLSLAILSLFNFYNRFYAYAVAIFSWLRPWYPVLISSSLSSLKWSNSPLSAKIWPYLSSSLTSYTVVYSLWSSRLCFISFNVYSLSWVAVTFALNSHIACWVAPFDTRSLSSVSTILSYFTVHWASKLVNFLYLSFSICSFFLSDKAWFLRVCIWVSSLSSLTEKLSC